MSDSIVLTNAKLMYDPKKEDSYAGSEILEVPDLGWEPKHVTSIKRGFWRLIFDNKFVVVEGMPLDGTLKFRPSPFIKFASVEGREDIEGALVKETAKNPLFDIFIQKRRLENGRIVGDIVDIDKVQRDRETFWFSENLWGVPKKFVVRNYLKILMPKAGIGRGSDDNRVWQKLRAHVGALVASDLASQGCHIDQIDANEIAEFPEFRSEADEVEIEVQVREPAIYDLPVIIGRYDKEKRNIKLACTDPGINSPGYSMEFNFRTDSKLTNHLIKFFGFEE